MTFSVRLSRHARRPAGLLGVALLAGVLSGCSPVEALAGVHPAPTEEANQPPVTVERAAEVATRVVESAATAEALPADDAGAAARSAALTGTAAEIATARAAYGGATAPTDAALALPDTPELLAIGQGRTYPRAILTTTLDKESNRQYLESSATSSVLEPYRLEHRVPMLPGASLPALPDLASGAPMPSADAADGLVMSPKAALEAYAADLTYPSSTPHEQVDMTDTYAVALLAAQRKQAGDVASLATYAVTQTAIPGSIRTFQLADGSVVMFGRIDRTDTLTAGENTKNLTVPEAYRAVVGAEEAATSLTLTYAQDVILLIPVAGEGKVTLLGVVEQVMSGSAR